MKYAHSLLFLTNNWSTIEVTQSEKISTDQHMFLTRIQVFTKYAIFCVFLIIIHVTDQHMVLGKEQVSIIISSSATSGILFLLLPFCYKLSALYVVYFLSVCFSKGHWLYYVNYTIAVRSQTKDLRRETHGNQHSLFKIQNIVIIICPNLHSDWWFPVKTTYWFVQFQI